MKAMHRRFSARLAWEWLAESGLVTVIEKDNTEQMYFTAIPTGLEFHPFLRCVTTLGKAAGHPAGSLKGLRRLDGKRPDEVVFARDLF